MKVLVSNVIIMLLFCLPLNSSAQVSLKKGDIAPNIELPSIEGKIITLNSLQGQYVLVDFWASNCRPCRRENPKLVKVYNEFKDSNFTILSVSLDRKKDKWQKAIEADNLNWPYQVSDLNGWSGDVWKRYGVKRIPTSFLVDPEGKIVNVFYSAIELKDTLNDLLKKS